jgi:hypothetical protein
MKSCKCLQIGSIKDLSTANSSEKPWIFLKPVKELPRKYFKKWSLRKD